MFMFLGLKVWIMCMVKFEGGFWDIIEVKCYIGNVFVWENRIRLFFFKGLIYLI